MRVAAILLALCLCAALVTADVDDTDDILTDTTDTTDHDDHDDGPPASCGASGVAGGWSTISSNVSSTLLAAVLDDFSTQYGANITAMPGGASPCPAEDITYSAAGCSQVRGTPLCAARPVLPAPPPGLPPPPRSPAPSAS